MPTNLWCINPFNTNGDIVAEELIGPVVIECRAREIDAAGIGIIARNDCDIGDGGGVDWRVESNKKGEDE